jgi:type II secretory pathway component GspD/PulD (secretin)
LLLQLNTVSGVEREGINGMKTLISLAALALTLTACTTTPAPRVPQRNTFSSFDVPRGTNTVGVIPAGMIRWQDIDVVEVLKFYQDLSRRSVLRSPTVLLNTRITFRNEQPLSVINTLRVLDTLLAQQGIAMVYQGDDAVKAVPAASAPTEAPPEIDLPAELLPESSSVMQRTVRLKRLRADEAAAIVAPFAHLPNSVIAVKGSRTLILRDYSANIRRMLGALETADR